MKKIEEWLKTCLRKKKLSEGVADSIIAKADIPLRKYLCPHCMGYHLTSKQVKKG